MFKSDNNKFIGIEGPARDGAMLVGADEPFHFDIWPDEGHPGAFKCARPAPRTPRPALTPHATGSSCPARTTASTSPTTATPAMGRSSPSGPTGRAGTRPGASRPSSSPSPLFTPTHIVQSHQNQIWLAFMIASHPPRACLPGFVPVVGSFTAPPPSIASCERRCLKTRRARGRRRPGDAQRLRSFPTLEPAPTRAICRHDAHPS
jgi:hypothetical protein